MGNGHFGASRGAHRVHKGIDYVVVPGQGVVCPVSGKVTKLGYPYANDLKYRYIEVTDSKKCKHRFFYTISKLSLGDTVKVGDVIAVADDISKKYTDKMLPHVHYEIIAETGELISPDDYFKQWPVNFGS